MASSTLDIFAVLLFVICMSVQGEGKLTLYCCTVGVEESEVELSCF
jgi:hypothetical protein